MNVIIGTAGHIDHGKTALVKALTGVDADRFPEEKRRGITIDIGFAELQLGDIQIGFVDVPGHEKFVKNMLAGASGIDAVMLVIAADEGVMPQTREHFEICRLLGVKSGIVVLTKNDLADDELVELVSLDVAELTQNSFLENAAIIPVSAKNGVGISELIQKLTEISISIPARKDQFSTRLPIDRAFSVKGFGAVVTGTLASGSISEGAEMQIFPGGKTVRIRSVQTHGKSVNLAFSGQRTAVNLGGVDHTEIQRGMVLCEKNTLSETQIFDALVETLNESPRPLRSRQRVRVHIGTVEALARIQILNDSGEIAAGKSDLVQLRLEKPIVAVPGERFILRSYSPQLTIGGGGVLDNFPVKHRKKEIGKARKKLKELSGSAPVDQVKIFLEAAAEHGSTFSDLLARTGLQKEILQTCLDANIAKKAIIAANDVFLARTPFDDLKAQTVAEIGNFHSFQPLLRGLLLETLREKIFPRLPNQIFKYVLKSLQDERQIVIDKDVVRLSAHQTELTLEEKFVHSRLSNLYASARLEVPKLEEALTEAAKNTKLSRETARKIFQLLVNLNEIVKISEEFYFAKTEIEDLKNRLRDYAESTGEKLIDVPKFKEIAGISRKYAIPLLEYFDREKITRRAGDKRLIL